MGGRNSPTAHELADARTASASASESESVSASASTTVSPTATPVMTAPPSKKRKMTSEAQRPPLDAPTPPVPNSADASLITAVVQPFVAKSPATSLGRMGMAFEMSRQLLLRSLQGAPATTSIRMTVQGACMQLEHAHDLLTAAQATDVDALARSLEQLFVGEAAQLRRLSDASARALRTLEGSSHNETGTGTGTETETETTADATTLKQDRADGADDRADPEPEAMDEDEDEDEDEDMEGRASTHEEVAAQALTGLRTTPTPTPTGRADAAAAKAKATTKSKTKAKAKSQSAAKPKPKAKAKAKPKAKTTAKPTTAASSTPSATPSTLPAPTSVTVTVPPPGPVPSSSPTMGMPQQPNVLSIPSTVPYNSTPMGAAAGIAAMPTISPANSVSIFATHLPAHPNGEMMSMSPVGGGIFIAAPPPGSTPSDCCSSGLNSTPLGTPGSLPSLFARGLLAPISTPYDPSKPLPEFPSSPFVASPMVTGRSMVTPNGQPLTPFVDWKNLVPPQASPMLVSASPATGLHSTPMVVTTSASASASAFASASVSASTPESNAVQQQQQAQQQVGNLYRPVIETAEQQEPTNEQNSASAKQLVVAMANSGSAGISMPIAKSLAALERTNPVRKANPRRWTKDEDDALRMAVESHKEKNWKAIAAQVPGRNHTQCLQRWTKVLAPGLVKGHWSPHEDELLRRLVAGGNKNWGEVAAKIPGRTSKQCRERWHNHLDPNIVRGAYTPEEDRIILEAQARLGNRWSVIAAMLPGRTEDAVKIRWKSHCRLWKARKYLRKSSADPSGPAAMSDADDSTIADDDDDGTEADFSQDADATPTEEVPSIQQSAQGHGMI